MRVLIFGDSITQGMWDTHGGWAQRLVADFFDKQLKDLDSDVPWVYNLGVSGDTTERLLNRFEAETVARMDAEVAFVFAIGTNDAWINADGGFNMSPEAYAANLKKLIDRARKYGQRILFVGLASVDESHTMPVSWIDISYTNERLALFEQTLQQVCHKQKVGFVPVFETFRKAQTTQNLLSDGLHPNDEGHTLLYELIRPRLDRLVEPDV